MRKLPTTTISRTAIFAMEAQEAQPQARRMPDLGSGELTLH
jgi:hypothetical protein